MAFSWECTEQSACSSETASTPPGLPRDAQDHWHGSAAEVWKALSHLYGLVLSAEKAPERCFRELREFHCPDAGAIGSRSRHGGRSRTSSCDRTPDARCDPQCGRYSPAADRRVWDDAS